MKTKIILATLLMLALPMTAQNKEKTLHTIRPEKIYEIPTMSKDDYIALLERVDEENSKEAKQMIDSVDAQSPIYRDFYSTSCSWYCGGKTKSVTASSALKSIHQFSYQAENADDFDHTTAWAEGVKGTGKGEYLEYTFEGGCPRITTVKILNGYCKNQQTWEQNGRVKSLKMYYNDIPILTLELEDSRTLQCFNIGTFGEHDPNAPDWTLRFEILDVYPGTKHEDTVISELYFDGIDVH